MASDRQASDVLLLDVSRVSSFADYLVIMTADSTRQVDALAEELDYALKRDGFPLHHREGNAGSGWVLLDFGDIVAHIFSEELRSYYQLEQLWSTGRQIVRIQ